MLSDDAGRCGISVVCWSVLTKCDSSSTILSASWIYSDFCVGFRVLLEHSTDLCLAWRRCTEGSRRCWKLQMWCQGMEDVNETKERLFALKLVLARRTRTKGHLHAKSCLFWRQTVQHLKPPSQKKMHQVFGLGWHDMRSWWAMIPLFTVGCASGPATSKTLRAYLTFCSCYFANLHTASHNLPPCPLQRRKITLECCRLVRQSQHQALRSQTSQPLGTKS